MERSKEEMAKKNSARKEQKADYDSIHIKANNNWVEKYKGKLRED